MTASSADEGYVALGAWSFDAALEGCARSVRLVERRGDIDAVEMRAILAPALNRSLVIFSNDERAEFGEVWMQSGLAFELASKAFCTPI